MTIYIDIVLLENLIMNYIILLTTAIVMKIKIKQIRLILAGLIGAIYTIIGYTKILGIHTSFTLKFILSIVIIYVAYNPQNIKKMLKEIMFFYFISFAFGGAAFAFIYIIKPQEILMKNGLFLGVYPIKIVILSVIVVSTMIITFTIIRRKIKYKDIFCEIEIYLNGKIIKTIAMIDSGNMLKEPITNIPVIVVEHTLLYECLPKEILNNLERIIGGDFKNITEKIKDEYMSQLKLIPYSSLGKQNGMLLGIKAKKVIVKKEDNENEINNIIIGIYPSSFTKRGDYGALIGIDLI